MFKPFTLILLFLFILGNAQITLQDSSLVETFFKEQKQLGKPIWGYVFGDFPAFNSQGKTSFLREIDSLRTLYTNHHKSWKNKINDSLYFQEESAIKAAFDKLILEYPNHHAI